jgi:hypothetical protein
MDPPGRDKLLLPHDPLSPTDCRFMPPTRIFEAVCEERGREGGGPETLASLTYALAGHAISCTAWRASADSLLERYRPRLPAGYVSTPSVN